MSDLINYYQDYHKIHGDKGYSLSKHSATPRVLTLKEWITRHSGGRKARILDIGCGDLYMALAMPEHDWVGLDINPELSGGKALKWDISQTPYSCVDGQFDIVLCSEVLEHVWDLRVIHKEVKRLLKPGGTYIISTPNHDWVDHFLRQYTQLLLDPSRPHTFEHIRFYNLENHEMFLNQAGFKLHDFVGSDARYSHFFAPAIGHLMTVLYHRYQIKLSEAVADQILGECFQTFSHTIIIEARHA